MRWTCPHCGTGLGVADAKIVNEWSFSRCYKCGCFAMIRKSDATLIRVDRAPQGEQVLLPEAMEDPTATLSKNAAKNLARYVNNQTAKNKKPTIRTVVRNLTKATKPTQPSAISKLANTLRTDPARVTPPPMTAQTQAQIQAQQVGRPRLPDPLPSFGAFPAPLPEHPETSARSYLAPILIGMCGALAIASGIYLYVQGQSMRSNSVAVKDQVHSTASKPRSP